ncbi:MAG: solute:Na+ symporter, family [Candidatus Methanomethylophilaceae archaeon]|nr:solute:Na+ symporter, family [Candidatus Methanomethylophilaceae archaeon]MDI3542211.1 solute:Na+ symporter, family [Candidatus Methanomethylophilaceae archaeon]
MIENNISLLIFGIVATIFLILTMALGYYGFRKTIGNEDFMVGGRKINPVVLALSYGATFLSTSAIIGFGGISGQFGMGTIWLVVLNIFVGLIVAFIVFGKRTRRIGKKIGALTFPDFLGKSFNSPFIQIFSAALVLIGMPIYSAAILLGGVNFVVASLGIDKNFAILLLSVIVALYVTYGGIIAVMYNDALQGGIMFLGMIVLLAVTYFTLGGVTSANQALTDMAVDPGVPEALAAIGMTGWTSFPTFASPLWYTFVTTFILGVGIGALAQPQLAVRYMTAESGKSLDRALMVGGIFILVVVGTAYTVGPLSNVYFYNHYGQTAIEYVGGDADMIIPVFVNELFSGTMMGEFFIAIFLLSLLAAAMSTLSSLLHTMGASAGYDIWRHLRAYRDGSYTPEEVLHGRDKGMVKSMRASRIGTMLMIVATVVITYYMPSNIIARSTAVFMGLTASALLPSYTYALFAKRPDAMAAKWSMLTGTIAWSIWALFIHKTNSEQLGLRAFLFGNISWPGLPWENIDPLIIALPLSAIVLVTFVLYGNSNK